MESDRVALGHVFLLGRWSLAPPRRGKAGRRLWRRSQCGRLEILGGYEEPKRPADPCRCRLRIEIDGRTGGESSYLSAARSARRRARYGSYSSEADQQTSEVDP